MAEQVTGIIGQEQVLLNNAATEATLRLILDATKNSSQSAATAIDKIAVKAGIDSKSIESVNSAAKSSSISFKNLNTAADAVTPSFNQIGSAAKTLTTSLESASSFSALALGRTTGLLGLFASGLVALLKFQEESLNHYRDFTKSGANFSGSLTDMRIAAVSTYMSLEEFHNVVKNNSEALAKMGTSVTDGVNQFRVLSRSMISSELGSNLMALGYTAEEINNNLITFASSTGRAANGQMADQEALKKATSDYLTELDAITQFTGVSRKKLEEDQKKANQQAAYQRKLASMAPEEAAKLKAAYDQASASGIKGATDLVMSTALGLPPMTEAARTLSGVMPAAAAGVTSMTRTAMAHGTTMKDVNREAGNMAIGAKKTAEQMGGAGDALSFSSTMAGQVLSSGIAVQNDMNAKGIKTADDYAKEFGKISEKQKTQSTSQAAAAAGMEKAMKDLQLNLYQALLPAINALLPVANMLVRYLVEFATAIIKHKEQVLGIIGVMALYKAAQLSAIAFEKLKQIKENGIAETLKKTLTGTGALGSKTNPMYVFVTNSKGGINLPEKGGGAKGGGAKGGGAKGGGLKGSLKGGAVGLVGGLALSAAGDIAKEKGNEKIGAGLDIAGDALSGASTGAMIGSLVGPLGTVVGGVLGGLVGGGYSAYQNWDTLSGKKPKKTEEGAEPTTKEGAEPTKMAKGGIVSSPTNILAGEAGAEAIIPLSGMPPITESAMKSLAVMGTFENFLKSYENNLQEPKSKLTQRMPSSDSVTSILKNSIPGLGAVGLAASLTKEITNSLFKTSTPTKINEEKMTVQLESLNNTMKELVKYMRDTAENTDKTHKATKSISGNLWA